MKKIFSILLVIMLVLSFGACSSDGQEEEIHEEILLEPKEKNYELANVCEDKYLNENGNWSFTFEIENTSDGNLSVKAIILETVYIKGGESLEEFTQETYPEIFDSMLGLDYEKGILEPGATLRWEDGHPGKMISERTYCFVFVSESGEEYTATFKYNLIKEIREGSTNEENGIADEEKEVEVDEEKDLTYILHNADFEVEIAKGVFWVPMNTLGRSNITNDEIIGMLAETPETKQEKIDTLYEALQLFQLGEFYFSNDNIRIEENGINWEHHKPGYNAVITNNGCCATCSNWLNYILKDDYEEVGFVAFSERDGSGHIYNYIKQDGWYYFIDMTHQTADWEDMALESGDLHDFYSSDYVLGNLLKVKNVEDYVDFYLENTNYPFGLMFMYTAENCLALDGLHEGDKITITYETIEGVELNVVYDDPEDKLFWQQVPSPTKYPKW